MARRGLAAVAIAALNVAAFVDAASAAAPLPNVVVLLLDDVGWGDFQAPLGDAPVYTPNLLDWLRGSNTVHFPRFYSGGPVCSPTRATVLTGRTNSRDCVTNVEETALPLQLQGRTLADVARSAGAATGFFGKWHLSSMTNNTVGPNCYPASSTNGTCLPGYIAPAADTSKCCDGRDAQLPAHTPLDFGFETVFATSQVAPTSTSNCGCLQTIPGAGVGCNLGHYAGANHSPAWVPGLECDAYFYTPTPGAPLQQYPAVTATDDADMLVDRFGQFAQQAVDDGRPFVAQISFHNCHIPYVAPPEFRALYANATSDLNEQDYYGCLSNADAAIGRVRALLRGLTPAAGSRGARLAAERDGAGAAPGDVAQNTLLLLTADNGAEINNTAGHSTAPIVNPGSCGGLRGRKRALTEGGIRVVGLLEAPFLVQGSGPLVQDGYPAVTMDILPTVMELYGVANSSLPHPSWPIDGLSLVSAITGQVSYRPSGLGHLSVFTPEDGATTCPSGPTVLPPGAPSSFDTPAKQRQVSWAEGGDPATSGGGGHLKLFGCRNSAGNWRFSLYNLTADPSESEDLLPLPSGKGVAGAMYPRMQAWLDSVNASRSNETMCGSQP